MKFMRQFSLDISLSPFLCFFRFLCFFGVISTLAFFLVQRAFGGSKKCSFDEKSVGRKIQNRGTEPFLGQKSAEKGKKAEKLRFFQLTHAFWERGDQG